MRSGSDRRNCAIQHANVGPASQKGEKEFDLRLLIINNYRELFRVLFFNSRHQKAPFYEKKAPFYEKKAPFYEKKVP
jgi:hypothetical protein